MQFWVSVTVSGCSLSWPGDEPETFTASPHDWLYLVPGVLQITAVAFQGMLLDVYFPLLPNRIPHH